MCSLLRAKRGSQERCRAPAPTHMSSNDRQQHVEAHSRKFPSEASQKPYLDVFRKV